MVVRLSLAKAHRAAEVSRTRYILGSDTAVSLPEAGGWRVFGKPVDREDTRAMLLALSGKEHLVHTGYALLDGETGRNLHGWHESRVALRSLDATEMEEYLTSGIADDKAGAYAIQDRCFHLVERVEGCVAGVMGLPLGAVREVLLKVGLPVADREEVAQACALLTGMPCCLTKGPVLGKWT